MFAYETRLNFLCRYWNMYRSYRNFSMLPGNLLWHETYPGISGQWTRHLSWRYITFERPNRKRTIRNISLPNSVLHNTYPDLNSRMASSCRIIWSDHLRDASMRGKIILKWNETESEIVHWIRQFQDRNKWWAFVWKVMSIRTPEKERNFLTDSKRNAFRWQQSLSPSWSTGTACNTVDLWT
jgi:hypothetical protein